MNIRLFVIQYFLFCVGAAASSSFYIDYDNNTYVKVKKVKSSIIQLGV